MMNLVKLCRFYPSRTSCQLLYHVQVRRRKCAILKPRSRSMRSVQTRKRDVTHLVPPCHSELPHQTTKRPLATPPITQQQPVHALDALVPPQAVYTSFTRVTKQSTELDTPAHRRKHQVHNNPTNPHLHAPRPQNGTPRVGIHGQGSPRRPPSHRNQRSFGRRKVDNPATPFCRLPR
jgi:hypothetical protein